MNKFRNLSIGKCLAGGFGLLLLQLGLMTGLAARQAGPIHEDLSYPAINTAPSLLAERTWADDPRRLRRLRATHVMARFDGDMTQIEGETKQAAVRLTGNLEAYEDLPSNDDEDAHPWQTVSATARAFATEWDRMAAAVSRQGTGRAEKTNEAQRAFVGESAAVHASAVASVNAEWRFNVGLAAESAKDRRDRYHKAFAALMGVFAAAVLAGLAVSAVQCFVLFGR